MYAQSDYKAGDTKDQSKGGPHTVYKAELGVGGNVGNRDQLEQGKKEENHEDKVEPVQGQSPKEQEANLQPEVKQNEPPKSVHNQEISPGMNQSPVQPGQSNNFKMSMDVDPYDASVRPSTSPKRDDMDEGVDDKPILDKKYTLPIAASEAGRKINGSVHKEPAPQVEENSLIQEGDSIVQKIDDKVNTQPRGGAISVMPGVGQAQGRSAATGAQTANAHIMNEYKITGNTQHLTPTNGQPSGPTPMPPTGGQIGNTHFANDYKISGNKQHMSPANDGKSSVSQTKVPQTAPVATENHEGSIRPQPDSVEPSPQPSPMMNGAQVQQNEQPEQENEDALNDSNIANLSDSLDDAHRMEQVKGEGNQQPETQSKMNNDFTKYTKDEAGMSIFAPPDIDYQQRADRAEAHLMKYDSDVRQHLEKVSRGLQQVFSNIQKINLSVQESTNRLKRFFQTFFQRAEDTLALYPYDHKWSIMQDRKDMAELKSPGNLKQLHSIFENMKTLREDWTTKIKADMKKLKEEYQSKIVEEDFYAEGIDKKSTNAMHNSIEKCFTSISQRNKKCVEIFEEINRKLEANKVYFEKNKKFKSDSFEDYVSYMRSVHKLWQFLEEAQDKLVKYWQRVKKMEVMRIKAISSILVKYSSIEEMMSTSSQNIKALRMMNDQLSPESMAGIVYNDRAFLGSAILEALGFNMATIDEFSLSIQNLKTKMPEIIEFSLWDYINNNTIVKSASKSIRIFRSNENVLSIYEVRTREEIPMEKPLFNCKVNNLILNFDEPNNAVTLRSSGLLSFGGFTFHLREHRDALELVNYVTKFCKNSDEMMKSGFGLTQQK